MSQITIEQLQQIVPKAKVSDLERILSALNHQLPKFNIDTPLRQAHFIAQIAHESGSFRYTSENLNYSAKALQAVFGKYFKTDEDAEQYARKPEEIANVVYANRMGNGDTQCGDGWRYRGRGLIQLTGKENYSQCSQFLGKDLVEQPELVSDEPDTSVAAACWYWLQRRLNDYADADDVKGLTKRINGGYHGLDDRKAFLTRCKSVLNISEQENNNE